jgi:peroxiredoxin (alkyl hydroperoxide reductase subunit C)
MSIGANSSIPRILDQTLAFEARSTHGFIKLSDYVGKSKWIMFFSDPVDFPPVCSTEFNAFAEHADEFENLNVRLIGTPVNSVPSHIAWTRDLEGVGNLQVKFPVIADPDHKVAQAYDIVHELVTDTAAVRSVFDIDLEGTILYFLMQVVRNVDEPIRLFQTLRTSDANGVSCPADWRPGDAVLVPAPATLSNVANRSTDSAPGLNPMS